MKFPWHPHDRDLGLVPSDHVDDDLMTGDGALIQLDHDEDADRYDLIILYWSDQDVNSSHYDLTPQETADKLNEMEVTHV